MYIHDEVTYRATYERRHAQMRHAGEEECGECGKLYDPRECGSIDTEGMCAKCYRLKNDDDYDEN